VNTAFFCYGPIDEVADHLESGAAVSDYNLQFVLARCIREISDLREQVAKLREKSE